ncbi:MAG: matrixin family metalloprotease, partial [Anaerolineae bacterium]|nr:matrixin family metalloprotease [Anaerolineae bacterium]
VEKYAPLLPSNRRRGSGRNNFTFADGDRWSATATNGFGLTQGDPTTLTWSIVPDGTSVGGFIGEGASPSNLQATLNSIYGGGQAEWLPLLQSVFDRWGALTGISYVYEPNDDGAAISSFNNGILGVRGDVRISGHTIDGDSGVLAYNFFPNAGDMVIDTADGFYYSTFNNSIGLRNVVSHEHGHGLGIEHVCPLNNTKLMEPFATTNFDGPQIDDILAANRGYGDNFEPNDSTGAAHNLGTLGIGTVNLSDISIDDNGDADFFRFTSSGNAILNLSLIPVGSSYLSGPQNENGSCSSGSNFNALAQSDLALQVLNSSGTPVQSANANGAGQGETITGLSLGASSTWYIRVTGNQNLAQLYQLSLTLVGPDLQITKTASIVQAESGQPIEYTINFSNVGSETATGIQIVDNIPNEVSNASFSSSGVVITRVAATTFTWNVADMAPGETGTITINGVMNTNESFTNQATISSASDGNATNNIATATVYKSLVYLPMIIQE